MGAVLSGFSGEVNGQATELLQATKARDQALFKALENKVEAMLLQIEKTRGDADDVKETEVSGGRTVMRVTEIRTSDSSGVDNEIMGGISDFLTIATGATPANAAVQGTKKLLSAGVNALLGASSGESREKTSFMVLFLGTSFARIDFSMYCYSVSAKKWGVEKDEAGFCYVADVAILKESDVHPEEAAYLISQSFDTTGDEKETEAVANMMLNIALLQRLQLAVMNPDSKMDDLKDTIEEYNEVKKLIQTSMTQLSPYVHKTGTTPAQPSDGSGAGAGPAGANVPVGH